MQIGCPEFTLAVVLLCAALSQQQLQVLHAYQQHIHKVFTGKIISTPTGGYGLVHLVALYSTSAAILLWTALLAVRC